MRESHVRLVDMLEAIEGVERYTALSRLISGELCVPDVESIVGRCA